MNFLSRFKTLQKYQLNKFFKKFLVEYADLIVFLVIICYKALSYSYFISVGYDGFKNAVISSILVFASFSVLFKNKGKTVYLYVLDLIFTIILVSDTVYYRYSKDVITIDTIRNGSMLGGVTTSVSSLLRPSDFLFFADLIILIPIIFFYFKIKKNDFKILKRAIFFILLFTIGIFIDGNALISVNNEQPGLLFTMSNRVYLLKEVGDINFHLIDAYNVVHNYIMNMKSLPAAQEKQIKDYLAKNDAPKGTVLKNAYKGKNLIIIQVEALQQFVINQKIDGQEITPNIDKWIGKSLYFNNYFYQVAQGNTSDAEFLSLNSLYPAANGAAYYMYDGDTYNSLAKNMSSLGYYAAALHGYQAGFWNRSVMYKAESFDDFYNENSYNLNQTVGMGLSDQSFLQKSLAKLQSFKQPYFSFLITLSSHYPYNDVAGYEKYVPFNAGKYSGTFLGDYLTGIHYTDAQLGMFLDQLDKDGILKNSIVVLYGDHFAVPQANISQLYQFEGITNPTDLDWYELQKVPMFIHFPNDANKGVNSIPSGQIDLEPTLSNLLGFKNRYTFGTDLINAKSNTVMFRNGSFTDGTNFYVSYADTYYDVASKKKIQPTKALVAEKNNTRTVLQYSDDLLNHNLIRKFLIEDSEVKKN